MPAAIHPTAREALARYHGKRDFARTPEPKSGGRKAAGILQFVVQKHHASHLHYDFRLELDGTLKSWAVPKGPCLDPTVKRMAVQVEDHPISYADFEGTIPPKQYGAGTVIVWDRGAWLPDGNARQGLAAGKLKFELRGEKLNGHWTLVRMRGKADERQPAWLLIKEDDAAARPLASFDVVEALPDSVLNKPATGALPKPPGKPAHGIVHEEAAQKMKASPALRNVSHADRVIDRQSGATKGDLYVYYQAAAALMLPHLRKRPVALVRAPAGVGGELFFQKHAQHGEIGDVTLLDPALDPGHEPLLQIDTARGLLAAAQMNTVELHTWNATSDAIDTPDRMTFDLDPGAGVPWSQVQEAALLVQVLLNELGLPAFLKTSGGKGLHVVVPLRRSYGWAAVKAFSQAVVAHLADTIPARFVAKSGPKNRVGKIFVDYLRNGFGATTASAWSVRARPGLGISVPVRWEELPDLASGAHWTLANIGGRMAEGNRPWAQLAQQRAGLASAMRRLGHTPSEKPRPKPRRS